MGAIQHVPKLSPLTGRGKQLLCGHTWTPPPGVRPALQCVLKIKGNPEIASGLITHRHWALDYPYTAGLEVRVGALANPWQMRPARIAHLYPPGTPYWERRNARKFPRAHQEVYMIFQGHELLRPMIAPSAGYARFLDPDGQLEKLLSEAAQVGSLLGDQGFWKCQALLCAILDRLTSVRRVDARTWRITGPEDAIGPSDFCRTVEKHLHEHFAERLTLADIARHAHVSASTLTHRYRAETGQTPMETLRNMRLAVAKGLLAKGWKLKEIAGQVGFVDAFHFSRTFKQGVGLAPRDFCRTLRKSPVKF